MIESIDPLLVSIAVVLIAVLLLVRRGVKPQGRCAADEFVINVRADTVPALEALRPVTAELQRQAELVERVTSAQCRAFDNAKAARAKPLARTPRRDEKKSTNHGRSPKR